jgi:NAD+ kinase
VNVALRGGDEADAAAVGLAGVTLVDEAERGSVDLVAAVGADAIRSLATDPPDAPVLPVSAEGGRHLVARESLETALARVAAGDGVKRRHPVVGVVRDGDRLARAVRDVALVTAAPASISEYALVADERRLASVRADGVVVATPLGSDGYAAAAGGPVLGVGAGVSVVPISPFSTTPEVHVVDLDRGLALSVEREGEVALFADGVRRDAVGVDDRLRLDAVDSIRVVVPRPR